MLRISAYTLGCKLNHSETESALAILEDVGYQVLPWDAGADLYLINTCTVTSKSEQKARRMIRQVLKKWPGAVVVATGCYAVVERKQIDSLGLRVCAIPAQPAQICEFLRSKSIANCDELLAVLQEETSHFVRAKMSAIAGKHSTQKVDFPEILLKRTEAHQKKFTLPPVWSARQKEVNPTPKEKLAIVPAEEAQRPRPRRQRFFLKIQDGCNRTCSFCRIRIARGTSRSLDVASLLKQLAALEAEGYVEVVITGVHINSYHYYSEDEQRDYFLGDLLSVFLENSSLIRFRLSSLEPEALHSKRAESLLQALESRRICPHFHISVQSGSEHVLRQMRRGYTAKQQVIYLKKLKSIRPDAFLSSDIIVGFPGEREDDFAATLSFLQTMEFSAVHGFSYSPRPGTDAFAMEKVQESVIKERMQRLLLLAQELHINYLQQCVGTEADVLLEDFVHGYWRGYTENYIRTKIAVEAGCLWKAGDLLRVSLCNIRIEEPQDSPVEQTAGGDVEQVLMGIPIQRNKENRMCNVASAG